MLPYQNKEELLEDAAARAVDNHVTISIRDLISHWGAKRRGYLLVDEIEWDLKRYKLTTYPPFNQGWIDANVELIPRGGVQEDRAKVGEGQNTETTEGANSALPQVSLQVGSLSSANKVVARVNPDDNLETAQSKMMMDDYSQLAVMSGKRNFKGAVSWESIAQARITNPNATLHECMVVTSSQVVRSDDDLLSQIPRIIDAGYVFVRGMDDSITGIVTTADLSNRFVGLAKPFFVLGEIERRLRRVIDDRFSTDDLKGFADPSDSGRVIESAHDMTMGEYVRLLENPDCWSKLEWKLDRKVFIDALKKVQSTRNEVMHFSPDPLDDDDLNDLENFLKCIKKLGSGH